MKIRGILSLVYMIVHNQNILIATADDSTMGTTSSMNSAMPSTIQNFVQMDQQSFMLETDEIYLKEIERLKETTQKKFETIEYIQNNSQFLRQNFPEYTDALNRIDRVEGTIILEFFPEDPNERVKQFERVIDQYKKVDEDYSNALVGMESFYKLRQMVPKEE